MLPLVEKLDKELTTMGGEMPYEILVCDDSSADAMENATVGKFKNAHFSVSEKNLGDTGMRQLLSEKARFETLIFLDADVMPKNDDFIRTYLKEIDHEVVFGGIIYEASPPSADKMLRWKYGKNRETIAVAKRKAQPYVTVNSGCFMIKRELFLKTNRELLWKKYGLDNYFKELLRFANAGVRHIDNPVYHLGLENSKQFLKKALEAIDTTVFLENENKLGEGVRPLQKSYLKLKRFGMTGLFSACISVFKKTMERNFLSGNPNLFWFDLYRLHYYIQLKRNKGA